MNFAHTLVLRILRKKIIEILHPLLELYHVIIQTGIVQFSPDRYRYDFQDTLITLRHLNIETFQADTIRDLIDLYRNVKEVRQHREQDIARLETYILIGHLFYGPAILKARKTIFSF